MPSASPAYTMPSASKEKQKENISTVGPGSYARQEAPSGPSFSFPNSSPLAEATNGPGEGYGLRVCMVYSTP